MIARMLPLKDKYYGTEIIIDTTLEESIVLNIWIMGNCKPSLRQLAAWDYPTPDIVGDMICDSHFESEDCYNVSKFIVNAINEKSAKEVLKI